MRHVEPSAFTRVSALGVEEQRVNVVLDLEAPHERWSSLGDGYGVEASILVWEARGVLRAPASAVFRHGEEWSAFEVVGGVARERKVEVGRRGGLEIQIARGLRDGARVIVYPGDRITDGLAVAAQ